MMKLFIWRNEDRLWPHGHICSTGKTVQGARDTAKEAYHGHPDVKTRILVEEPIQVFKLHD